MSYSTASDLAQVSVNQTPIVEPGGLPPNVEEVAQLAQNLLCISAAERPQQSLGQGSAQSASEITATDISLEDPKQLRPEIRDLLQRVGVVAERAIRLPSAQDNERYFVGREIYKHVLDGCELVLGRSRGMAEITPAIAKREQAASDVFDRTKLAPALGHLGVLPLCLERGTGLYITEKFSEDGIDYINNQHQYGSGLSLAAIWRILREVVSCVSALHAQGLVHHDLKLENVVLQLTSDRTIESVKLIDIDSVRFISEQHIVLELLPVVNQLKMALSADNISDPAVLPDVCSKFADRLRDLEQHQYFQDFPAGELQDADLRKIQQDIHLELLQRLSAVKDAVENVQNHQDSESHACDILGRCDAFVNHAINILGVMHTPGSTSKELCIFLREAVKLKAGACATSISTIDLRSQDVWSIGVMVLILLDPDLGEVLNQRISHKDRLKIVSNSLAGLQKYAQKRPNRSLLNLIDCLSCMLAENSNNRSTIQDLQAFLAYQH